MNRFTALIRRPRLLAGTAASAAAAALVLATVAATPVGSGANPGDKWLTELDGKYRQFFDSPAPAGGIALVHILNYYDTYNKAYNVADKEIDAVGTFYGATTFYGLNDAMWDKYRLGEFLETANPATGKPATVNPWRTNPNIIGMSLPQASIESLQKRGATFILCNNALSIFSGVLAKARGLDPATVYADMRANILPGVYLVPGMVVAVEQAHAAGLAYHRQ